MHTLLIVFLIMCTDIFDSIGQTILKSTINYLQPEVHSVKKAVAFVLSLLRYPRIWCSFSLSTVSLCIWLVVLTMADLNFAYAIDSMRYIFIALASTFLLKERIGLLRWLGIAAIVLGILLVARS
jgi:uncharacterized membrane protein